MYELTRPCVEFGLFALEVAETAKELRDATNDARSCVT